MTGTRSTKRCPLWGDAPLAADAEQVGPVEVMGLGETLFAREGRWRTRWWCTSIMHMTGGRHHAAIGGPAGIASSVGVCSVEVERGVGL